jgi:hypothetical protein
MTYLQYTQCVPRDKKQFPSGPGAVLAVLAGLGIYGGIAVLLSLLVSIAGGFAIVFAALGGVLGYCRWWLYDRLVCLGGEKTIVGFLLSVATPQEKTGLDSFDTDYSLNIVLQPHREHWRGHTDDGTWVISPTDEVPQDVFLKKQPSLRDEDQFRGEFSVRPSIAKERKKLEEEASDLRNDIATSSGQPTPVGTADEKLVEWLKAIEARIDEIDRSKTEVMHCEFEGAGVYELYQYAKAASVVAAVGAVGCSIPIIGWIVCAIAAVVLAVLAIAGVVTGLNATAKPTVENSPNGELMPLDGQTADLLLIRGEWVYDSAHEGWNELHPIRFCQWIGTWSTTDNGGEPVPTDKWTDAINGANDPGTRTNQQRPENQWEIHPEIDGCIPTDEPRPEPEPEPEPGPIIH